MMKRIEEVCSLIAYTEKVVQFGEGNFLRAFTDWMLDKMNKESGFDAGVVVIQPLAKGMVPQLNAQQGQYTLFLNGIKKGEAISEKIVIDAIQRGINPYDQVAEWLALASQPELEFVISNTTEAGIAFDPADTFEMSVQNSFPGKLTAFLYRRFMAFEGAKDKGLIMIPCELINKNGEKLKEVVLKYADNWSLPASFIKWIKEANTFCNSLVDRIVPGYPFDKAERLWETLGYEDNLMVEGEQFHLWVIETEKNDKPFFPAKASGLNIIFTEDLTPYRTRKVRILNGAHTTMVPVGLLYGIETVKEAVEDEVVGKFIHAAIFDEIIPTLDLSKSELDAFGKDVLDRFKNPYVKHYLQSISLNSNSKFETRVLPSLLTYLERTGTLPKKLVFALAATIVLFKGDVSFELKDDAKWLTLYKELWNDLAADKIDYTALVTKVLGQTALWQQDLNDVEGLTEQVTSNVKAIHEKGMKEAIKEVL